MRESFGRRIYKCRVKVRLSLNYKINTYPKGDDQDVTYVLFLHYLIIKLKQKRLGQEKSNHNNHMTLI